ncbi:MAG: DUF6526 family protein [Ignavibacteriaceae bacterium]|nr:DUF6526 family protein [Ignavibacteriaceae bacterium]
MKEQSYSNHRRYVTGYHFVLLFLSIIVLAGSIIFLFRSYRNGGERVISTVVFLGAINFLIIYYYTRSFAIAVQNRAIRAEENLRHFILTGKLFDPGLSMSQIIALRFASDLEFPELANRALAEKMSNDEIKKAIKNWKPDYHRA